MTKEITTAQVEEAMAAFCPFGYRDVEKALETIQKAEGNGYLDTDKLVEIMDETIMSIGGNYSDHDPVYVVYDYYHQIARTDIESVTGKDISNDDPYSGINVYGNYMCTTFDGTDEKFAALKELIESIPEEDKTYAVKWLLAECDK